MTTNPNEPAVEIELNQSSELNPDDLDQAPELDQTLAAALVAALAELDNVARARTANTGTYSYAYADLGDVLAACRPILAAHDLALSQHVACEPIDGGGVTVTVTTSILHASGAVYRSPPLAAPCSANAQQIGSLVSYLRRYSVLALLGIAAGDDDDGAAASRQPSAPPPPPSPTGRTLEEARIRELRGRLNDQKRQAFDREFRDEFGCALLDLDPDQHPAALSWALVFINPEETP